MKSMKQIMRELKMLEEQRRVIENQEEILPKDRVFLMLIDSDISRLRWVLN